MKEELTKAETNQKIDWARTDFQKNQAKYAKSYQEGAFLKIVKRLPKSSTCPFVRLYYIMQHPGITVGGKALCVAALGYVVLPLDIIPDVIPVIGWLDDAAVVAFALAKLKTWSADPWVQERVEAFYA